MAASGQHIGMKGGQALVEGDSYDFDVSTGLDLTGATVRWAAYPWPTGPKYGVPESIAALTKTTGDGILVKDPPTDGIFKVIIEQGDTTGKSGMHGHEAEVVLADGQRYTLLDNKHNLFLVTAQRLV